MTDKEFDEQNKFFGHIEGNGCTLPWGHDEPCEEPKCETNLEFMEDFGAVQSDTHAWKETETFPATVQILKCSKCGEESSAWKRGSTPSTV